MLVVVTAVKIVIIKGHINGFFLKGGKNMRNQILEDLKTAMKNQDKERLSVIRMVKGAIQMS